MEQPWTPVPHRIVEALYERHFTLYELRVILMILRKTYGFEERTTPSGRREFARIANKDFVGVLGIRHEHISRAIKSLVMHQIVFRTSTGTNRRVTYQINKNVDQWGGGQTANGKIRTSTGTLNVPLQVRKTPGFVPLQAHSLKKKERKKEDLKERAGPLALDGATAGSDSQRLLECVEHDRRALSSDFRKLRLDVFRLRAQVDESQLPRVLRDEDFTTLNKMSESEMQALYDELRSKIAS